METGAGSLLIFYEQFTGDHLIPTDSQPRRIGASTPRRLLWFRLRFFRYALSPSTARRIGF
jgi:hypothetical protein